MARNYFSHDSNAQNDEKIINMRMDHGPAGYGVYWMIVERLRDADGYRLTANYKALAFAMMCDEALVRSVVEDYGLFVVEGGKLHSESLMRRMDKMDERSRKAKEAAEARWGKAEKEEDEAADFDDNADAEHPPDAQNADAMRTHSERNAHPMLLNKIKSNQTKESKPTPPAGARARGEYREDPPKSAEDPDLIDFFASLEGTPEMAAAFFNHFASQGWLKANGMPISAWRPLAHKWITEEKFNPGKRSRASPGNAAPKPQKELKYPNPNNPW
jgi:hypothetical protein